MWEFNTNPKLWTALEELNGNAGTTHACAEGRRRWRLWKFKVWRKVRGGLPRDPHIRDPHTRDPHIRDPHISAASLVG